MFIIPFYRREDWGPTGLELGVNPSNLDSEPKLLTVGLCISEGSPEKKSQ